jgi:nitrogen regulatory protein PII
LRRAGLRDDLPLMVSLRDLLGAREVPHRTLLSVVDSQEKVDQMVAAAQAVIGDLDDPHTGFLFVVPVSQAYGLGRKLDRQEG